MLTFLKHHNIIYLTNEYVTTTQIADIAGCIQLFQAFQYEQKVQLTIASALEGLHKAFYQYI
jgi:hypothetical protein